MNNWNFWTNETLSRKTSEINGTDEIRGKVKECELGLNLKRIGWFQASDFAFEDLHLEKFLSLIFANLCLYGYRVGGLQGQYL